MQDVLEVALGGMPLTTTVEGLERYSLNLRYDRDFRENLESLREIIVPTPAGAQVPLGQLAPARVHDADLVPRQGPSAGDDAQRVRELVKKLAGEKKYRKLL